MFFKNLKTHKKSTKKVEWNITFYLRKNECLVNLLDNISQRKGSSHRSNYLLLRQLLRNNRPIIERCTRVYSERYSVLLFRPSVKSWSLTFTFDQSQPRQPGPNQSQSPSGLSGPDPGRGLML